MQQALLKVNFTAHFILFLLRRHIETPVGTQSTGQSQHEGMAKVVAQVHSGVEVAK